MALILQNVKMIVQGHAQHDGGDRDGQVGAIGSLHFKYDLHDDVAVTTVKKVYKLRSRQLGRSVTWFYDKGYAAIAALEGAT